MNDLSSIAFSDLPSSSGGFSELYCDYVADFRRVEQFFSNDFRHPERFGETGHLQRNGHSHSPTLIEVLTEQNSLFGAGPKTFEHIQQLADARTSAVVTGQQLGVAGGPMYTIYKTLTAIRLAKALAEAHPGFRFVPVFWLEGEDHDFAEISPVGLIDQENNFVRPAYVPGADSKRPEPTGTMQIDEGIVSFFDELRKLLPATEFRQDLLERLRTHYRSGISLTTAFASWLGSLFPDEGVVFLSPSDRRLKKLASGIFRREIEEYPAVSQLIIQQSALLEDRYHAQIKTRAMNLFMLHKGGRYLIEPRENDFSLKGTRHFIGREEMLRIASEEPELLSPNVALRPIVQDSILPTTAYVAGPSEVSYFAQLLPVYEHFGLRMPVIYPRISATVVDERTLRTIEKFELQTGDLFTPLSKVERKVVDMISEVNVDEMFSETQKRIADDLGELKFGLQYIDQTLVGALDTTREKTAGLIAQLKERALEARQRRHDTALRQLRRAAALVYPGGEYQERTLNVLHFLNRYGPAALNDIAAGLDHTNFSHQLVKL